MTARILNSVTSLGSGERLEKGTVLTLGFQPIDPNDLYKQQFPDVWKRITLSAGANSPPITFTSRLAVGPASTEDDIASVENWAEIEFGQQSAEAVLDAHRDPDQRLIRSTPEPKVEAEKEYIAITNNTVSFQNFSLGLLYEELEEDVKSVKFEPVFVWPDIGHGHTLKIQFAPKLRIYEDSGHKEGQIIRTAIDEKALGTWDLARPYCPPDAGEKITFAVYNDKNNEGRLTVRVVED